MKRPLMMFDLGTKLQKIAEKELARHDSDAFAYAYGKTHNHHIDKTKVSHVYDNGCISVFYDKQLMFERREKDLVYTYKFSNGEKS